MSEITRLSSHVPNPDEPIKRNEEMSQMLQAIKGPLAICATMAGAPEVDLPLQRDYAARLVRNGISASEAVRAFDVWRDRSKFFPQPAELIEIAKARKPAQLWRPPDALPGRKAATLSREERMQILLGHGKMGADLVKHLETERTECEVIEITDADRERLRKQIEDLRGGK